MARTIVDRIVETKRQEVKALRERWELRALKEAAAAASPARNFFAAVTARPAGLVNVVAEIKRASPSAGVIREQFDPQAIAREYAAAGASAISVLTDEPYFQGRLEYIEAVRDEVGLPVLRKDFILDPWQVYESRAAGADAILLIAAILPAGMMLDLLILAAELRMTALVEVHGADELLRVRSAVGFPHRAFSVLGINNRDLTTFEVDVNTTIRLMSLLDEDTCVVSESGIRSRSDVERLAAAGVRAVLVGERLMRCPDIAAAMAELFSRKRQ